MLDLISNINNKINKIDNKMLLDGTLSERVIYKINKINQSMAMTARSRALKMSSINMIINWVPLILFYLK
jgi:hypothetical protein